MDSPEPTEAEALLIALRPLNSAARERIMRIYLLTAPDEVSAEVRRVREREKKRAQRAGNLSPFGETGPRGQTNASVPVIPSRPRGQIGPVVPLAPERLTGTNGACPVGSPGDHGDTAGEDEEAPAPPQTPPQGDTPKKAPTGPKKGSQPEPAPPADKAPKQLTAAQLERQAALRALIPALNPIMRRKENTPWSKDEKNWLRTNFVHFTAENIALVLRFYRVEEDARKPLFRRTAMLTLLKYFPGEVDKARAHFRVPPPTEKPRGAQAAELPADWPEFLARFERLEPSLKARLLAARTWADVNRENDGLRAQYQQWKENPDAE